MYDAGVVPANCQPDLGWGSHISERVKKLAAPSVTEQRRAAGRLDLGEACCTDGTGTPFAHLIHAAAPCACVFAAYKPKHARIAEAVLRSVSDEA